MTCSFGTHKLLLSALSYNSYMPKAHLINYKQNTLEKLLLPHGVEIAQKECINVCVIVVVTKRMHKTRDSVELQWLHKVFTLYFVEFILNG